MTRTICLGQQEHWHKPPKKLFLMGIDGTMEHIFSISAIVQNTAWPTTRYDLPRPRECLWIHLLWVISECAITLQTPTGDYYLYRGPIHEFDCICEDKGMKYRQVQDCMAEEFFKETHPHPPNCPTSPVSEHPDSDWGWQTAYLKCHRPALTSMPSGMNLTDEPVRWLVPCNSHFHWRWQILLPRVLQRESHNQQTLSGIQHVALTNGFNHPMT